MKRTILAFTAIFLAGFAPNVQASEIHEISAGRVEWFSEEGSSSLEFLALEIANQLSTSNTGMGQSVTPIDAPFNLKGRLVSATFDTADYFLQTPAIYGPAVPNLGPLKSPIVTSSAVEYNDAVITGQHSRDGRFLRVFPFHSDDISIRLTCGLGEATSRSEVFAPNLMATGPPLVASVEGAVEVSPCPGSMLVLEGDFIVSLWEWDATIHTESEDVDAWSGKRAHEVDARPVVSQAQQVYLAVEGGRLELPGDTERPPRVFVRSLEVDADQVTLRDAVGTLGPIEASGNEVVLTGDVHLGLKSAGDRVDVAASGPATITVDGQAVFLASVAGTSKAWPWPWLAGAGSALTVGAVLVLKRRRNRSDTAGAWDEAVPHSAMINRRRRTRAARALGHASECLLREQPRQAMLWATRARRLDPGEALAPLYQSQAQEQLHHPDAASVLRRDALEVLARCDGDAGLAAEIAYQEAESQACRGDLDQAESWLDVAIGLRPSLALEAASSPNLVDLLEPSMLPEWLRP